MAKLHVQTPGLNLSTLALRLGLNHVGRGPDNDFQLDHPTVSTRHCELIASGEGVVLHDCDSTNGTFVNGQPVSEIWLEPGQVVRLGDVELLVASTEFDVSIPHIEREKPAPPPVVLADGAMLCPRHPEYLATFQCSHCREIMCSGCVRIIRRKGGQPHYLCLKCHHPCVRINDAPSKKKKGFFGFLQDTVRLKFGGRPKT